jgi:Gram-negative bacterial TonB protein C-terminal
LKIGEDIKAPIPFAPTDATKMLVRRFLDGADCKVSVVVDRYGMPSRLRILDAGQPGHEQPVASIVRLWRFKPAMRNNEPVPVRIEFRL